MIFRATAGEGDATADRGHVVRIRAAWWENGDDLDAERLSVSAMKHLRAGTLFAHHLGDQRVARHRKRACYGIVAAVVGLMTLHRRAISALQLLAGERRA